MKKNIIKILCCFIPWSYARHQTRKFLESLSFQCFQTWRKYLQTSVPWHSVLVMEPNDCHGEVVSGYVKYFLDLGYHVDVFLHQSVYQDKPLAWATKRGVRIYGLSHNVFKNIGQNPHLKAYEHILLTSSAYYFWAFRKIYPASVDILKLRGFKNLLVVEHELSDVTRFAEQNLLKAGHLLTLGKFAMGGGKC